MNRLHTRRKSDRRFILFVAFSLLCTAAVFWSLGYEYGVRVMVRSEIELRGNVRP